LFSGFSYIGKTSNRQLTTDHYSPNEVMFYEKEL